MILKQAEQYPAAMAYGIHQVPLEAVLPHRQPMNMNDPDNQEGDDGWTVPKLMRSMKTHGFSNQAPLTMLTDGQRGELDDGHHRLEAAQRLGLKTVPVDFQEVGFGRGPALHPDLSQALRGGASWR